MDSDIAWENFKKSNKTSVDDKLDVIMAQQQEILADTSRTADLVPLVTGDKAEEDALKETGEVEGEEQMMEDVQPEGEPDIASDEPLDESDEDNPFAFLDEEDSEEDAGEDTFEDEESPDLESSEPESDEEPQEDEYEETDEDFDIIQDEGTEDEFESDEESEDSEEFPEQTEETEDEPEEESEYESEDDESEDGYDEETEDDDEESKDDEEYISFDEIDEDEQEDEKTKKSIPVTKTIKSYATSTPMTIVNKSSGPSPSVSYGRASSAEEISRMLTKSLHNDSDFDIGYGVDPHKVVENDWAEYRMMKKLNSF